MQLRGLQPIGYIMTDMNKDVNIFIDACDQVPSIENISLYRNLINEEFWEFQDALKAKDDVEQLDACMDMIWVILGYCRMKGFGCDYDTLADVGARNRH